MSDQLTQQEFIFVLREKICKELKIAEEKVQIEILQGTTIEKRGEVTERDFHPSAGVEYYNHVAIATAQTRRGERQYLCYFSEGQGRVDLKQERSLVPSNAPSTDCGYTLHGANQARPTHAL